MDSLLFSFPGLASYHFIICMYWKLEIRYIEEIFNVLKVGNMVYRGDVGIPICMHGVLIQWNEEEEEEEKATANIP